MNNVLSFKKFDARPWQGDFDVLRLKCLQHLKIIVLAIISPDSRIFAWLTSFQNYKKGRLGLMIDVELVITLDRKMKL